MKKILVTVMYCALSVCILAACGKEQTINEEVQNFGSETHIEDKESTIQKEIIYSVELTDIGNDWESVVKAYRDMTGLGVKEARDRVFAAPCILLETSSPEEAELYKTTLEECGATVNILESTADTSL